MAKKNKINDHTYSLLDFWFFCLKKMLLGIFSSRFLHLSEKTSLFFFRRLPSALLSHAIFPSYKKKTLFFFNIKHSVWEKGNFVQPRHVSRLHWLKKNMTAFFFFFNR